MVGSAGESLLVDVREKAAGKRDVLSLSALALVSEGVRCPF